MSVAWVGVGIAALSTGLSASGALNPNQPDLASSSKELADTEAMLLPIKRQLESLAQQGAKGTITIPGQGGGTRQVVRVNGEQVPYVASEWEKGGKYYQENRRGEPIKPRVQTIRGGDGAGQSFEVDFTGVGSADVQGAVAQKMAQIQLDLAKKYDSQFIEQSLAQERLADPESFAAREMMDKLIHEQINRKPERPVADTLQKQVGDELSAAQAGTLDPATQAILDQATADAMAARGGNGGVAGDFGRDLTTGFEGAARRTAALNKAQGWLSSGATPEDVEYRREQQNLANLSAEVTGQTPTSQFRNLSAAQQGPTPTNFGQPLSQLPTNTTQVGQQAALMQGAAQQQAGNPWLQGMSTLLNVGAVAGKAGWKPFG